MSEMKKQGETMPPLRNTCKRAPPTHLPLFFRWLWELISKIGDLLMILRFTGGLGSPAPLFTSAGKDHPWIQRSGSVQHSGIVCVSICTCACADISLMFSIGKAVRGNLALWEPTPRAEKISQPGICACSTKRLKHLLQLKARFKMLRYLLFSHIYHKRHRFSKQWGTMLAFRTHNLSLLMENNYCSGLFDQKLKYL